MARDKLASVAIAKVEAFFQVRERGSTLRVELFAGFVCFLANAYQLVLIPTLMHNHGEGFPKPVYFFAFSLTTAFSSILVGITSNLPVPTGVGIGCTTYMVYVLTGSELPGSVANTVASRQHYASTVCFVSSAVITTIALLTLSWRLFRILPTSVKAAMPVGLGLLLALDGCHQLHLVVPSETTGLTMGDPLHFSVIAGGLCCIGICLMNHYRCRTSTVVPMLAATFVGWAMHGAGLYSVDAPPPSFGNLSVTFSMYADSIVNPRIDFASLADVDAWTLVVAAISLYITVLFDVGGEEAPVSHLTDALCHADLLLMPRAPSNPICLVGVTYAIASAGDLVVDAGTAHEHVPGAHAVFVACGLGSLLSASLGCAPVIVLGESFAGVMVGGRTGLTAVAMAVFFLLAIPVAPLVEAVPTFASAPVLIMLGVHLLGLIKYLDLDDPLKALPAFCAIVGIPFFYNIANGVLGTSDTRPGLRLCLYAALGARTDVPTVHVCATPYTAGLLTHVLLQGALMAEHLCRRASSLPRHTTPIFERAREVAAGTRSRTLRSQHFGKQCLPTDFERQRARRLVVMYAMEEEEQFFLPFLEGVKPLPPLRGVVRMVTGTLGGVRVDVAICGIGAVHAAVATTAILSEALDVDAVISVGCSGAHLEEQTVGDVVVGSRVVPLSAEVVDRAGESHLVGVRCSMKDQAVLGFDACPILLRLGVTAAEALRDDESQPGRPSRVDVGVVGSSDVWRQSPAVIAKTRSKSESVCEEMEAHAVAQVCALFGTPFLSIKDIANSEIHPTAIQLEPSHHELPDAIKVGVNAARVAADAIRLLGTDPDFLAATRPSLVQPFCQDKVVPPLVVTPLSAFSPAFPDPPLSASSSSSSSSSFSYSNQASTHEPSFASESFGTTIV